MCLGLQRELKTVAMVGALSTLVLSTAGWLLKDVCKEVGGVLMTGDFSPVAGIEIRAELQSKRWPSCQRKSAVTGEDGSFTLPWDGHLASSWLPPPNFLGLLISDTADEGRRMKPFGNLSRGGQESEQIALGLLMSDTADEGRRMKPFANPSRGGQESEQIAFCDSLVLRGKEVQKRFLDTMVPFVQCPSGKLVTASLVMRTTRGLTECGSLCPNQTCGELVRISNFTHAAQNHCLMGNVRKNFFLVINESASTEAALPWLAEQYCPPLLAGGGMAQASGHGSGGARHVEPSTPLSIPGTTGSPVHPQPFTTQGLTASMSRSDLVEPALPSTTHDFCSSWDEGKGMTVLLGTSGTMSSILQAIEASFPRAEVKRFGDSLFSARGSIGQGLLKVLESVQHAGTMVVIVSDFQDGADTSFCEAMERMAKQRHTAIALESVELPPQQCLILAALATGGSVRQGRFGSK